MKKCLLSVLLTCTMLLGMNLAAYAAYEDGNGTNKNVGVSEQMPAYSENMGRSISMPSKSSLYTTGETYSVSGTASRSDLYTNNCFYGVSSIYSYTKNYSSKKLTVRARYYNIPGALYAGSYTVSANGGTASTTFSGLKSNKYYFLQFEAPSDFSGSVRGNR